MKLHWEVEGPYETLNTDSALDALAEYDRLVELGENPILYEVIEEGNETLDHMKITREWILSDANFEEAFGK